jgi:DNA-binding response OmpR family regulator
MKRLYCLTLGFGFARVLPRCHRGGILGQMHAQRGAQCDSARLRVDAWPQRVREGEGMEATILVLEDDEGLSCLLSTQLRDEGYQVLLAGDGVQGLRLMHEHQPDLVLLDVMMPLMDGWETCRRIREVSAVPIIMLTCRTAERDIVRGLELGADDYVVKPYRRSELLARIQAVLRRRGSPLTDRSIVRIDERLAFDRTRYQVLVDGRAVDLSATEYKLLSCFVDNANHTLAHQSLLTQVWGWEYAEEIDYLKVYVHHLRQKIEHDPKNPCYILTKRGIGYRFNLPRRSRSDPNRN